jgi:YcxB-like protein
MKLNIQLTEEDYIKANYLNLRSKRFLMWAGCLAVAFLAITMAVSAFRAFTYHEDPTCVFVMAGAFALFVFFFKVRFPQRLRHIFRQQKSLHLPYSVEFTDAGIVSTRVEGETKHGWDYYRKWNEGKTLFLLFQSEVLMNMIPKRCFASPEEMAEFRELLAKKIGAAK